MTAIDVTQTIKPDFFWHTVAQLDSLCGDCLSTAAHHLAVRAGEESPVLESAGDHPVVGSAIFRVSNWIAAIMYGAFDPVHIGLAVMLYLGPFYDT